MREALIFPRELKTVLDAEIGPIAFFLEIVYVLLVFIFVFVMMYYALKDLDEIDSMHGITTLLAALMMAGSTFFLAFYLITLFIIGIFAIIAMYSGFWLIFSSKPSKIVNISLFAISLACTILPQAFPATALPAKILQGVIYLISVGESYAYLLWFFQGFEGGEAFAVLSMMIYILTTVLTWLGVEVPSLHPIPIDISDLCFITGALIGYTFYKTLRKGKRGEARNCA